MKTELKNAQIHSENTSAEPDKREKVSSSEHWKQRLSSLPLEQQTHIADKYYGGHFAWKF